MLLIPARHIFFLFTGLLLVSTVAALEVPYLSGRVSDQAELLGNTSREKITSVLRQLEQARGAQVAVLTIPSLQGEALETYSIKVVETWKLGRKDMDDGVLLLIVRDDRRIRIEVGYGLEGVLTDLDSRRIIDNLMQPAFRQGGFEEGIESAVLAIRNAIMQEPGAIPTKQASVASRDPVVAGIFLVVVGVILLPASALAVPLKGKQGWTLYAFLAPFYYFIPMMFGKNIALIALVCWIVLVPLLRLVWPKDWRVNPGKRAKSSRRKGGSGGFSRGGGFSGGGGSFGGGGASGGW